MKQNNKAGKRHQIGRGGKFMSQGRKGEIELTSDTTWKNHLAYAAFKEVSMLRFWCKYINVFKHIRIMSLILLIKVSWFFVRSTTHSVKTDVYCLLWLWRELVWGSNPDDVIRVFSVWTWDLKCCVKDMGIYQAVNSYLCWLLLCMQELC